MLPVLLSFYFLLHYVNAFLYIFARIFISLLDLLSSNAIMSVICGYAYHFPVSLHACQYFILS